MKKYTLKKGACIGKPGLPKGKLGPYDKDTAISEEHAKLLVPNMHHFVKAGKVLETEVKDPKAKEGTEKKK